MSKYFFGQNIGKVDEQILMPGYITLDFQQGFIDEYRNYEVSVSNWHDVHNYFWGGVDLNQVPANLQITTTDDFYKIYPTSISKDGRYLYISVAITYNDNYFETILFQDSAVGEEYEYQDQYGGTFIGEVIKQYGLLGYITTDRQLNLKILMHKYTCQTCGYVAEEVTMPTRPCPQCKQINWKQTS